MSQSRVGSVMVVLIFSVAGCEKAPPPLEDCRTVGLDVLVWPTCQQAVVGGWQPQVAVGEVSFAEAWSEDGALTFQVRRAGLCTQRQSAACFGVEGGADVMGLTTVPGGYEMIGVAEYVGVAVTDFDEEGLITRECAPVTVAGPAGATAIYEAWIPGRPYAALVTGDRNSMVNTLRLYDDNLRELDSFVLPDQTSNFVGAFSGNHLLLTGDQTQIFDVSSGKLTPGIVAPIPVLAAVMPMNNESFLVGWGGDTGQVARLASDGTVVAGPVALAQNVVPNVAFALHGDQILVTYAVDALYGAPPSGLYAVLLDAQTLAAGNSVLVGSGDAYFDLQNMSFPERATSDQVRQVAMMSLAATSTGYRLGVTAITIIPGEFGPEPECLSPLYTDLDPNLTVTSQEIIAR